MNKTLSVCAALLCLALAAPSARADLLGIQISTPPVISSSSGWAEYSALGGTNEFDVSFSSLRITFADAGPFRTSTVSSGSLRIQLQLDDQGRLIGGVTGADLKLTGAVTEFNPNTGAPVQTYSGDLIIAEVLEVGFRHDEGLDTTFLDFRFRLDGGNLKTRIGASILGVTIAIEGTGFDGFDNSFSGTASVEAGPVCGGTIGDRVWNDLDRDGIQDFDESGIAGITVTLTNLGSSQTKTKTTDANGQYLFPGLCAGSYRVTVGTLPLGFEPTIACSPGGQCTPETDSNTSPATTALATDESTDASLDFGYFARFGGLSGRVWHDMDGDKIQDPGEPGLSGIAVQAQGPGGTKTTNTDANGRFSWNSLPAGSFTVCVTPPAGFVQTYDPDFPATPNCATVDVDESVTNADFGYQEYGSLGDRVWDDVDGDGVFDGNESALAGWTVNLTGPSGPLTATTNNNGVYRFNQLLAGTYVVCVVPVSQYLQTYDLDGTVTKNCATIPLAAGQDRNDVDFGYQKAAKIGNLVWDDLNGDGKRTTNEPGLANVRVQLVGPQNRSKLTGANGTYSFGNIPGGTYTVCVAQPSGYRPTFDRDGIATANCATVTVKGGETRNNVDFGYGKLVGVGGRVWDDLDGDGVQDALEPGKLVDQVTLTRPDASTLSVFPDGNGTYVFPEQTPGVYSICVTPPDGYRPTYDPDGIATPHCATFTLTGTTRTDLDFGYKSNPTPEGRTR